MQASAEADTITSTHNERPHNPQTLGRWHPCWHTYLLPWQCYRGYTQPPNRPIDWQPPPCPPHQASLHAMPCPQLSAGSDALVVLSMPWHANTCKHMAATTSCQPAHPVHLHLATLALHVCRTEVCYCCMRTPTPEDTLQAHYAMKATMKQHFTPPASAPFQAAAWQGTSHLHMYAQAKQSCDTSSAVDMSNHDCWPVFHVRSTLGGCHETAGNAHACSSRCSLVCLVCASWKVIIYRCTTQGCCVDVCPFTPLWWQVHHTHVPGAYTLSSCPHMMSTCLPGRLQRVCSLCSCRRRPYPGIGRGIWAFGRGR